MKQKLLNPKIDFTGKDYRRALTEYYKGCRPGEKCGSGSQNFSKKFNITETYC